MSDSVKREYRSQLRTAQAAATRRAVVAAAAQLFVAHGYGATTVDAVASAAGVSRKTVFTAVGGKAELLKTAIDWAVAGDEDAEAVQDRARIRELLGRDEPTALLADWAGVLVEIDERVAGLYRALDVAAEQDADAALLQRTIERQRLTGARSVVNRLAELGALRVGMSQRDAADVAWLATDPVLYERLVGTRGWTASRFEAWLSRTLATQLLDAESRQK